MEWSAAESVSVVAAALAPREAQISADVYQLIVREIPQLGRDQRIQAVLQASVAENIATLLHVLQHNIDLGKVHAPAAAEEYARRLAQRGAPIAALLRAYRIGSARFVDWCLQELGQHHVGVVTWMAEAAAGGDALAALERATGEVAAEAGCDGRPMFVPQDEFGAWAWLPLGSRRDFVPPAFPDINASGGQRIRFAFGEPATGVAGFRRTHQQALSAQAVALSAGPAAPAVTTFAEVAPLALMSGSLELLRAWVTETLGPLADDDDHNARLRDTLRVFLQENGSYKATAERLTLHKNTVQYRVRKAEDSLRHPIVQDHLRTELALLAAQWLGPAVLRSTGEPS